MRVLRAGFSIVEREPSLTMVLEALWTGIVVALVLLLADWIRPTAPSHRDATAFVLGMADHVDPRLLGISRLCAALAILLTGWDALELAKMTVVRPLARFSLHISGAAAGAVGVLSIASAVQGSAAHRFVVDTGLIPNFLSAALMMALVLQIDRKDKLQMTSGLKLALGLVLTITFILIMPESATLPRPPQLPPNVFNNVFRQVMLLREPLQLNGITVRNDAPGTANSKLIVSINEVEPTCTPTGVNGQKLAKLMGSIDFEDGTHDDYILRDFVENPINYKSSNRAGPVIGPRLPRRMTLSIDGKCGPKQYAPLYPGEQPTP